jgi:hypothetical protein
MDKNEYLRKKLDEGKDHAADGKKGFRLSEQHKHDIIIRDLGAAAMDDIDLDTTSILLTMLKITNDDLMAEGKLSEADLEAL